MNTKELLWSAIRKWGVEHQTRKAVEEMGELICELTRIQDGRTTQEKIREEIADVWIMIKQLIQMYGESEIMNYAKVKLERLGRRINEQNCE